MAQTDRTTGLKGNVGMKIPVRAASTAALVLTGEQTVDGVALVTGDRVLVKDQASGVDNGIYVVDTGAWSRSKDFNGAFDVVQGSMVRVNSGSQNGDGVFVIATADPITIGTTSLSFTRLTINYIVADSLTATAGQTLFNLGITYQVGSANLAVYVNGFRKRVVDDYTESSASSITFTYQLEEDDEVDVYAGLAVGNLVAALAVAVAITDAGDYYLASTVEAVLQELAAGIAEDVGDTNVTFTNGSSDRVQRWDTPLGANRTLTLSTSNAKEGATCMAVRGSGATGAFTLAVGSLATLRAPGEWAIVKYDAGTAAWVLVAHGFLPSAGLRTAGALLDADTTLTVGTSAEVQRCATALTADRAVTLSTTGAWAGAKFSISRAEAATGNFAMIIDVGGARLARLAPGQWATFEHNGTTWVITGFGDLRPGLTSVVRQRDDFTGEEIDGYRWQSLIGTDAACRQATVLADQAGGVVRLTTGADAGGTMALNGVQLQGRLNWRADKGCFAWEARLAVDAITNLALYMGLTDQVAALEMPFTLSGVTLTSNATNGCGVLFDTGATNDTWHAVGVAADVDAAMENLAVAPVAATFETWRVELDIDGEARFYRNNALIGSAMTNAVTGSALLTPVVAGFARGAVSRNIDVDVIDLQQQR